MFILITQGEYSMNINDLLKYNGISPCPEDIDKYWDDAVAEMKKVDPDVELIKVLIYRSVNGVKNLVYDSKNATSKVFIDKSLEYNSEYEYSIIPYYDNGNKTFYGKICLNVQR